MIKNLSLFFLQINLSIPDTETKKIHRIMCFGNSSLFGTLACNVQIYIDVTFNIIPIPFFQCLIVMVYKVQISVYGFVISIPDIETKKMHCIMFYGNFSLFRTLAGNVQIYIDGTFNIIPIPFYQCLIVMVYDIQTFIVVPVMYVIMTRKSELLYQHAICLMLVASN